MNSGARRGLTLALAPLVPAALGAGYLLSCHAADRLGGRDAGFNHGARGRAWPAIRRQEKVIAMFDLPLHQGIGVPPPLDRLEQTVVDGFLRAASRWTTVYCVEFPVEGVVTHMITMDLPTWCREEDECGLW